MQVICIDAVQNLLEGGIRTIEGEVYNVLKEGIGYCIETGESAPCYALKEDGNINNGYPCDAFIPLSTIDEMEMIEEINYKTA